MKQVDVYEISKTVRTVEGDYDEVWMHAIGPEGLKWGNPDGGSTFVRYPARIVALQQDGKRSYIACGQELQEKLEVWASVDVREKLFKARHEIQQLEAAAKNRIEYCNDLFKRFQGERDARGKLEDRCINLEDAKRNFLKANVITRIWRAIVGRL